jgi:hypothetical protein
MELLVLIGTIVLAVGVIVHTIIFRYTASRATRLWTIIIAAIVSIPFLVIALIVLFAGDQGPEARMWALGLCGILFGYWFKSPFRMLRD